VPLIVKAHAGDSIEGTDPKDAVDGIFDPDLATGWRARPDGRSVALELELLEPRRVEKVHLVVRPLDGDLVRTRVLGQDENGTWHPIASGGTREEVGCGESRVFRLASQSPKLSRIRVEIQGEGDSFRVALHEIWIETEGGPSS
jgi:hypothetical protein